MTSYKSYIALALAALLVLTSQSLALVRTTPGPAGQIVLCTGTGPVSVLVDAKGQPTGILHICPDCTLSALTAITTRQFEQPLPLNIKVHELAPSPVRLVHASFSKYFHEARAPPDSEISATS